MKVLSRSLAFVLLIISVPAYAAEHGDMQGKGESTQIWDQTVQAWVSVEMFWLTYAETRGGLTWGQGQQYPDYDQVNERDTFLVELQQGSCLMEFFHSRWRRANDVRRWNEQLNQYGGCPYVFD